MPPAAICFTPRLPILRPPLPPHLSSRNLSTSLHHFPLGNLGWRNGTTRSSFFAGKPILVSPFKVISYLPNSDDSSRKEEAGSSRSQVGVIESVPESVVFRRSVSSGRITLDPFRGKSGCVSFRGLSHQLVEAKKLVSSPFEDGKGSVNWIVAPIALISSLLLPQFFINNVIDFFLNNEILTELVASFVSELIFYTGLAVFLSITDRVQRPYIEFSPKQWSLITGLRGYMSSAFFIMGIKVVAPLLGVYAVWPVIGLPAAIAVAPFLLGCTVQFAFELHLDKRRSSCWPVLPIIFEVYRLYQLNKGAYFLEKLIFSMKGARMIPEVVKMANALGSMVILCKILAVVCLWSLTTFLLRLFPSRLVAENC